MLVPALGASAAEIPDAITAVEVTATSAEYGDQIRVDVRWALPDSAAAGDTFWLQLPPELARRTTTFELSAPDGAVVARAVVAASGRVTFTVTDFVETHDQVAGSAYLVATFVAQSTGGETLTLTFPTSGSVFTDKIEVNGFSPIDRSGPVKAGFWTDPDDQGLTTPEGALTWAVASPRGPSDRVEFRDTANTGQSFRCTDLVVERTTRVDPFSGYLLDLTPVPESEYTAVCSPDAWSVTLDRALAEGEIVQVSLTADITDPTLPEYTNDAEVTTTTTGTATSATVSRFDAGGVGDGDGRGPLTIVKKVNGPAAESAEGLFTIAVDCVWNGRSAAGFPRELTFDGPGSTTIQAPIASLCTATEPEDGGAAATSIAPAAGVTVTKDATGTVELVVTNTFSAAPTGSFVLSKELAGPVTTEELAPGTSFAVAYTVDGVPVEKPLVVVPGEQTFSPQFPVGTEITLRELEPDEDILPRSFFWTDGVFTVDGTEADSFTIVADGEAQPGTVVTLTNHMAMVVPPTGHADGSGPALPDTGSAPWLLPGVVLALTLIVAGSVLVRVARRPRTDEIA